MASLGCQPPLSGIPKAYTLSLARIIVKIVAFLRLNLIFPVKIIKIVVLFGDENQVLLQSSMLWCSSVARTTVFPHHQIQISRVVEIPASPILPCSCPFLTGNSEECPAANLCHEGERFTVHGRGAGCGARHTVALWF